MYVDWLDFNYTGKTGIVTGWGRLSEKGNISPILRQVKVPIYSNAACQKTRYGEKAITENMVMQILIELEESTFTVYIVFFSLSNRCAPATTRASLMHVKVISMFFTLRQSKLKKKFQ